MSQGPSQQATDRLRSALAAGLPAAAELRRWLHRNPEPSGEERATADRVAAAIGGTAIAAGGTGRLVGADGSPGQPVLRAELDGLPITETAQVPWRSVNGCMHACGHDVHLAAVTAVCRAVAAVGETRPPAALLQPREELAPSGAAAIVAEGVLPAMAPAAIVAAHVQPAVPAGVVAATPGVVNASVDEFLVTVTGTGGHAGYPGRTRDAGLALCHVMVALGGLAARYAEPGGGLVCSAGQLQAGSAPNVVPALATARGTIRLLSPERRDAAIGELRQVAEGVAAALGCAARVDVAPGEPVLRNDEQLTARTADWLAVLGSGVSDDFRSFGADDFSHYAAVAPGVMLFAGSASLTAVNELHHPEFVPDDDTLALVAGAYLAGYLAALGPAS